MSLFDILNSPELKSTIGSFADKAKSTASDIQASTPGGLGGLLGAGAVGALLGTFASKRLLRDAALVGAGAVVWNFYQKWSRSGKTSQNDARPETDRTFSTTSLSSDTAAMLMLRAMVYSARADGHIDAAEQARITRVVEQMFPGRDMSAVMNGLMTEPIQPSILAEALQAPEQGEDVYRLSCFIVDVDHFMERSYLDALAAALNISPERKAVLEQEAAEAAQKLLAG